MASFLDFPTWIAYVSDSTRSPSHIGVYLYQRVETGQGEKGKKMNKREREAIPIRRVHTLSVLPMASFL